MIRNRPTARGHLLALVLVMTLLFLLLGQSPSRTQTEGTPSPFGVAQGNMAWTPFPALLRDDRLQWMMRETGEVGAGWLRLNVAWGEIERQDGELNWSIPDAFIEHADRAGIKLLLTIWGYAPGQWIGSPELPAGVPREPHAGSGEAKLRAYERFMRALAQRYRGKIRFWQIEHEVDGSDLGGWMVPIEEYPRILQTAYRTIKQEDPSASILIAGLMASTLGQAALSGRPASPLAPEYIRRAELILERGREHFDILDLHIYTPPHEMAFAVEYFRRRLLQLGHQKAIWVTETGGPHPCWYRTLTEPPPAVQASEVVKRYTVLFATGVERVFWFGILSRATDWISSCPGHGLFGYMALVRSRQLIPLPVERRSAFITHKLMVQKLSGFRAVQQLSLGQGVWAFRFSKPGGDVYVVWADRAVQVNLPLGPQAVRVTDITGSSRQQDSANLAVTTLPVFVETGN